MFPVYVRLIFMVQICFRGTESAVNTTPDGWLDVERELPNFSCLFPNSKLSVLL
jgi:hypothetical protein